MQTPTNNVVGGHLVRYPDRTIVLPLRSFASVSYYATMATYGKAAIDTDMLFDKRMKDVHRYEIADPSGRLRLTIPIVKPHGVERARWTDVRLSDHGNWWHVHRASFETAYGRTPFFEFYIDNFLPFLCREAVEQFPSIAHYDVAVDATLRKLLLIETDVQHNLPEAKDSARAEVYADSEIASRTPILPYYQLPRLGVKGFVADLSVLDLLFNLGPEAPLYLRSCGLLASEP